MNIDLSRLRIDSAFVDVDDEPDDYVSVRAVLMVRDVRTGEPCSIVNREMVHRVVLKDGKVPAYIVRDLILRALKHEIDECLYVDGERVAEPHPVSAQ